MKNFKRFTAAVAATLMAASLSIPMAMNVSAADITISSSDSGDHTYEAYQVFTGTLSGTVLSDIQWGSGIDSTKVNEIYEALKTKNAAFSKEDNSETLALSSAQEIADVLAKETTDDTQITKDFADVVAKYLTTSPTGTSTDGTISGLADGYYLVQDQSGSPTGTNTAKTRYILEVAGENVEVNAKSNYPTVMKKVQEESLIGGDSETTSFAGSTAYDLGDGYNDIADYDIGDSVPFKLYGTLPSNYDDYKQYYYEFTDTLGTEFNLPKTRTDYKVKIDGEEITGNSNGVKVTVSDNTIKVTFENLKAVTLPNEKVITKDSVITVEYFAVLNNNAKLGVPGQVNGVNLTYSNNPNQESGDEIDKGTTPDDGVIVFTYGVDINKYTGSIDNKLANAKFAIYKMNDEEKTYLSFGKDGITELTGRPSDADVAAATMTEASKGIWVSTDSNDIQIKGLDAGTYYIEELAAPDSYNKLTAPIEVTVTPTYMTDRQVWEYSITGQAVNAENNAKALTELEITNARNVSIADGKGKIDIENKQGSTLPSTGGMGTKLFYLGGGAMVAVAGIVLITKKRMSKNAE